MNIRKILLPVFLILLTAAWLGLAGQNRLEFSRVLLVTNTTQTVPAGKAWKIENVIVPNVAYIKFSQRYGGNCGCGSTTSYSRDEYVTDWAITVLSGKNNIAINGQSYAMWPTTNISEVIWLPENTTVASVQMVTPQQQAHVQSGGCYIPWWLDGVFQACADYTPPQVTVTPVISVIEFSVVPN